MLKKIKKIYQEYLSQRLVVDFGSHSVKIACPMRGILVDEPSIIIVNGSDVIAVGEEADKIKSKIPNYYRVIFPIKRGHINDFDAAEVMMEYFLNKCNKTHKNKYYKPSAKMLVSHGTNTTPIQEKNLKELFLKLGAYDVSFVSQTIASAIGAEIPINNKKCYFLFNMGFATSEFIIVSDSKIIESKVINKGGFELTEAIREFIFQKEKLQISYDVAENLKKECGNLTAKNSDDFVNVIGQDKFMNIPKEKEISVKLINQAINYNFRFIFEEFMKIVDKINSDIAMDIYNNGIYLLGGSSELTGLDDYVEKTLNIKVKKFKNARHLSLMGCLKMMECK